MGTGPIVVVGAGPCGLACAATLVDLGHDAVRVLEAAAGPGGLASSTVDAHGFTWDRGGHVVFSHYGEFDRLLERTMGRAVLQHERSSFVSFKGRWVPYPFQLHLHHLAPEDAVMALDGLEQAANANANAAAGSGRAREDDFGSWILRAFGAGIAEQFMRPYNEKVWAHPLAEMSSAWMAERVAEVPLQAARDAFLDRRDIAWGPNSQFAFPEVGGTGEIFRRAADALDSRVRFGTAVESVHVADRVVRAGGDEYRYDHLVWTGALDELVQRIDEAPAEVRAAADTLVANEVTVVGVGYRAPLTDERSWLYFPDPDVPFYRATNFAKYSPAHVPGGRTDVYSSWMTEVAHSASRPLGSHGLPPAGDLPDAVDRALRRVGLVPRDAQVASVHIDHVAKAYPVPTRGRDAALAVIQPWLMAHGIFSRGRFGAWRYELGNMDHAVKMGADVARRVVLGAAEEAWAL